MYVADQVEQRVKVDPHDIHKVPVQSDVFDRGVVMGPVATLPSVIGNEQNQSHTDDHVQSVEPGHREIEGKEYFDLRGIWSWETETGSGKLLFGDDVSPVLDSFNSEESQADRMVIA